MIQRGIKRLKDEWGIILYKHRAAGSGKPISLGGYFSGCRLVVVVVVVVVMVVVVVVVTVVGGGARSLVNALLPRALAGTSG